MGGRLPPCLLSPRMAQLYLEFNQLTGAIPDAFAGAPLLNLFQADDVRELGQQLLGAGSSGS